MNFCNWDLKLTPKISYWIHRARWVDAPAETIFQIFVSMFQSRWRSVRKTNLQWDWLRVGCKNQQKNVEKFIVQLRQSNSCTQKTLQHACITCLRRPKEGLNPWPQASWLATARP
jgi:hypothetical protein